MIRVNHPFIRSLRFPTTFRNFYTSPCLLNQKINFYPPNKSNKQTEKRNKTHEEASSSAIQLQPNEVVYEMASNHITTFNKTLSLGLLGVFSVLLFTQLQIVLDYCRNNLMKVRDIKDRLTDIDSKCSNTSEEIIERVDFF